MVYVFLANGFEEIEALSVVDILRRLNIPVQTVSVGAEKEITGSHGIPVLTDISLVQVDEAAARALVLPGGLPGADNLQNCETLMDMLKRADSVGTLLCAICAAPKVLGAAGLLRGKKAVCYPGFEEELLGATPLSDPVCRDGHIITARGAAMAADFAFAIGHALGADTDKIYKGMLYQE